MFQSLFCWKSVWEQFHAPKSFSSVCVSILVLLEIGLGAMKSERQPGKVQVSILVLLEIGLGDEKLIVRFLFNESFNPCFVGNRSGRLLCLQFEHQ